MAITQDRMLAIIAAAEYFRDRDRELRRELLSAHEAPGRERRIDDLILQVYQSHEEGSHVETVVRESVHFKHAKHKNNYEKRRREAERGYAQGIYPDPPPPRRAYTSQFGVKREQRLEAPPIPDSLPTYVAEQFIPEDLALARSFQKELSPQEQKEFAQAQGFTSQDTPPAPSRSSTITGPLGEPHKGTTLGGDILKGLKI